MPWRPPEPGVFPTLGYQIGGWIESNCVIPDGIHQGDAYLLTDEMWRFLIHYYRLKADAVLDDEHPSAAFFYRGAALFRPQKWGKGPFAASITCGETWGPVRFDGWDAAGQPVGRPHPTPWAQLVATSEEQTDNTWLALYEMVTRGPIANFPGLDIGIEDINLPSGGKIEPRTASGRARLGARLTFANLDETGLMVESNGGVLLATTMKRNIAGMGGRWLETSNMYDPSERSVAQRTYESKASDVFIDYRPPRRTPDLSDREGTLGELRHVYGDSHWVDVERIYADATDTAVCPTPGDAYRFFLNLPVVGISDLVDATIWDALKREHDLAPGERIAVGFDGSRSGDCTSIVASRISDGRLMHIKTWNPADQPDHKIPRAEVDAQITALFAAYDVWYLFADPFHWETDLDTWSGRWPKAQGRSAGPIVQFNTNAPARMDSLVSRFLAAIASATTHDGDPTLTQHIRAAAIAKGGRKLPRPEEDPSIIQHYQTVTKKRQTGHIDAAVAAMLALEARGKAIDDGALNGGELMGGWI